MEETDFFMQEEEISKEFIEKLVKLVFKVDKKFDESKTVLIKKITDLIDVIENCGDIDDTVKKIKEEVNDD